MKAWRFFSSVALGFVFSFSVAVGYLNLFQYDSIIDRAFLLGIPMLAFGAAIYYWPDFRNHFENISVDPKKIDFSKIPLFILENRSGFFLAIIFFIMHLFLARTLNHPALNYNTVLFESDAGPWLNILASPEGDSINRAVHPLMLLLVRPLVRLAALVIGGRWRIAALGIIALMSASSIFMMWLLIKRAAKNEIYAALFACIFGISASQLIFGSLTDTYIFGTTTLLFFLLLVQAQTVNLSLLSASGVAVFGVTITNLVQSALFLFFNKFGIKRIIQFSLLTLGAAIILTEITGILYPNHQTLFFVPKDISVERSFVKPLDKSPEKAFVLKAQVMTRAMFLYGIVAPEPIADISNKKTDPYPTIDIKTFNVRSGQLASYKGLANVPLLLWLILLAGAFGLFFKNLKNNPHSNLISGLLASLAFNFILHMNYGSELFLYTSYWVYALILFISLAYAEFADKKWAHIGLLIFVLILAINNANFIYNILKAIKPFFASTPA